MTRETLVLQGDGKIVTLAQYKSKHLQRLIEEAKPKPPQIISPDEFKDLLRRTSFRCPKKHHMELCNGTGCPTRRDNPHDDYFDECVDSRSARLKIDKLAQGKIIVANNHQGWEIKTEF